MNIDLNMRKIEQEKLVQGDLPTLPHNQDNHTELLICPKPQGYILFHSLMLNLKAIDYTASPTNKIVRKNTFLPKAHQQNNSQKVASLST
jgi:hypothetical protein